VTENRREEWRLFDISSASASGVGVWKAEIETMIDIATPQLLAFARLQSLV